MVYYVIKNKEGKYLSQKNRHRYWTDPDVLQNIKLYKSKKWAIAMLNKGEDVELVQVIVSIKELQVDAKLVIEEKTSEI